MILVGDFGQQFFQKNVYLQTGSNLPSDWLYLLSGLRYHPDERGSSVGLMKSIVEDKYAVVLCKL
jgi:hypothetical protein